MTKKFILRNVAISFACLAAATVFFASCEKEDPDAGGELLTGQVFITPAGPVAVGNTLVAVYTEGDIPEEEQVQVKFQWKKGKDNAEGTPIVAGNQSGYTPTTTGEYSVVVSAPGYQSKTSNVVVVTEATGNSRGTSVASQYRGVYPSVHEGVGGITLNLGENSISWTGSSSGNFPDVSTGSDQAMTWALGGSWAYLYSGDNKIGIVWRYSALGVSTLQNILIGQDKVQLYQHTVLSQMGITSVDVSDIAQTVPDIEGEIDSNGSNGNGDGDGNNNPTETVINKAMIEYEPLGNITADVVKIIVCFDFTDGNKKFRRDTWVSPPDQPTYHTVAVADDIARTYFSYTTLTAELGWADVSNNGTVASNAKHEATHFDRSKYKDVAERPDALQYVLPDEVIAGHTCNVWRSGTESSYILSAGYHNIEFKEAIYLNNVLTGGRVATHFSETVPENAFTKTVNIYQ